MTEGERRRVAVTGMGFITPIGHDPETVWDSLRDGRSGIGPITRFDASDHSSKIAGEVRDFEPARFMDAKSARNYCRYIQYALAAAQLAVGNAALDLQKFPTAEVGVVIGTAMAGLEKVEEGSRSLLSGGVRRVSPFTVPMMLANMAPAVVAIQLAAGGPNYAMVSACAASGHAIGDAVQIIRRGGARVMLAGGSEAGVTPLSMAGFCQLKAMSGRNHDPAAASRPFDRGRDGFVMSEGAVMMVLEDMEQAMERGARIWAEVAGYAATSDAFHYTAPDPEGVGVSRAMTAALDDAGVGPEHLDYISAHATSTPVGDVAETRAIRRCLGDRADSIPVSATKSVTGHMLGAAGAMGAAAAIFALTHQTLPPTINLENQDPECDLDLVPNLARPASVDMAMTTTSGFGGHNASIILRRAAGSQTTRGASPQKES